VPASVRYSFLFGHAGPGLFYIEEYTLKLAELATVRTTSKPQATLQYVSLPPSTTRGRYRWLA
jgi:hypothetical protein